MSLWESGSSVNFNILHSLWRACTFVEGLRYGDLLATCVSDGYAIDVIQSGFSTARDCSVSSEIGKHFLISIAATNSWHLSRKYLTSGPLLMKWGLARSLLTSVPRYMAVNGSMWPLFKGSSAAKSVVWRYAGWRKLLRRSLYKDRTSEWRWCSVGAWRSVWQASVKSITRASHYSSILSTHV